MTRWELDSVGNWRRRTSQSVGESETTTEVRQHNKLHQITAFGDTACSYDAAGNLTDDGTRLLAYDALNRLVQAARKSDSLVIGSYRYDAAGRRVQKTVSHGGLLNNLANGSTDYLYDGAQCLEERQVIEGTDTPVRQYVWGRYVDELVQQWKQPKSE